MRGVAIALLERVLPAGMRQRGGRDSPND
jgi:hypothetical protein